MSREQAVAFLKLAAENAELQAKIVALAAEEGYAFTVEELTDAEMDAASGGAGPAYLKLGGIKVYDKSSPDILFNKASPDLLGPR